MRITLLIAIAAFAAPALAGAPSPHGLWMTEKKGVVVDLYDCGDRLCGRTVWMKRMHHRNGEPRLDRKNPDPALRERHWCGIEAITGLRRAGETKWEGGEVYDPKTGETFGFELKLDGERAKVRGYLGIPLLGKSETWTRADADGLEFCAAPS